MQSIWRGLLRDTLLVPSNRRQRCHEIQTAIVPFITYTLKILILRIFELLNSIHIYLSKILFNFSWRYLGWYLGWFWLFFQLLSTFKISRMNCTSHAIIWHIYFWAPIIKPIDHFIPCLLLLTRSEFQFKANSVQHILFVIFYSFLFF